MAKKKYKAKLIMDDGNVLTIMVSRRKIVKLIGRDKKKSIIQRLFEYLNLK